MKLIYDIRNRDEFKKYSANIGIRLELFNIDESKNEYKNGKVIYYNFDGEPTGLKRTRLEGDYTKMGDLLYDLTVPLQPLLAFLLLGKDLALFSTAGVPDVRARRDDVIHVTGIESYRYALLPLLEASAAKGCRAPKPTARWTARTASINRSAKTHRMHTTSTR